MAGIDKKDTFVPLYAPPSEDKERLVRELGGKSGIEALLHVLKVKRSLQRDTIDVRLFALVAKTGAGKSTTMVYRLWKALISPRSRRATLICTQPRVNLAKGNPSDIERIFGDVHMGVEMGYITGGGSLRPTADRNMLYCTTMTLQILMSGPSAEIFGRNHPIVVIDEAHDESMEMLTTLSMIKIYIEKNHKERWCPTFIITSATIDPPTFISYFGGDPESPYNSGFVEGMTRFPIKEKYLTEREIEGADEDKLKLAVDKALYAVKKITKALPSTSPTHTDILVFWPTAKDLTAFIEAAKDVIDDHIAQMTYPIEEEVKWGVTYIVYSRLEAIGETEHYQNLYRARLPGEIRIISSTPILEPGATLPHLAFVVDSARQNTPIPFPMMRTSAMILLPISNASRTQRSGRVGRTGPGTYIGLYSEATKEQLSPTGVSSTLTSNDVPSILYKIIVNDAKRRLQFDHQRTLFGTLQLLAYSRSRLKSVSLDVCNDVDLLNPMSMEMMIRSMGILSETGLLEKDGTLSISGLQLSLFGRGSIAESVVRSWLTTELLHPFDIELLCVLIKQSLMESDRGGPIMWGSSLGPYYPSRRFGFRDPPVKIQDVIDLYINAQRSFGKMASLGEEELDKGVDTGAISYAVGEALNRLDGDLSKGAFFTKLYVDLPPKDRAAKLKLVGRSLYLASSILSKKGMVLEGEVHALKVIG